MNNEQHITAEDLLIQQLRSKATELILREQWQESIQVYTQLIQHCQNCNTDKNRPSKPDKSLCIALCNRAESRAKLRDYTLALEDCDHALQIDNTHYKTLLCKGKILLGLDMYSLALACFEKAMQVSGNRETVKGYFRKCKKLESLSKSGGFDLSEWVGNGFQGKCPELGEYIGAVQVGKSEISGRGLFATKNIDAGNLVFVTRAVSVERGIFCGEDNRENAQLVMWKSFIDKFVETTKKCPRLRCLVDILSTGDEEDKLEVPDMSVFRPEKVESYRLSGKLDLNRIMCILDVNVLVEDAVSAKVLGNNSDYYGVGLWGLASFINHSCNPNVRRLHVGDYLMVHTCRDIKAGEEITFAYFDALVQLEKRREISEPWGFKCSCRRCKFEDGMYSRPEIRDIEVGLGNGIDVGNAVYRLEECMKRLAVRGKDKGYIRASYWCVYAEAYNSEKSIKRWGRKIPPMDSVVDSVIEAVGIDERVLKMVVERLKKNGGGTMEVEKAMKMGRGVYGKVVKRQAMRALLEL